MAYHFIAADTGLETMGIGQLGRPELVFKRKFRWTLAFNDIAYCVASNCQRLCLI